MNVDLIKRIKTDKEASFAVNLFGNGQVARALRPLLSDAGIPVATVHTSRGIVEQHEVDQKARVLVDLTTPRYAGPRALHWNKFLQRSLREGRFLVTANKAPLATCWNRIRDAATEGGVSIRCTATVGGGTPVIPTLLQIRSAHGVRRIEASLSGTLSYVIEKVADGRRLIDAVWEAQEAGYAEPDPALDLDGIDVAAKAHILHRIAFPDADVPPLRTSRAALSLSETRIRDIRASGAVPQVVATIEPGAIAVGLTGLTPLDPLAARAGEAAVRFKTADGQTICISGPGAGASTTAKSVLGDLLGIGPDPGSSPVAQCRS